MVGCWFRTWIKSTLRNIWQSMSCRIRRISNSFGWGLGSRSQSVKLNFLKMKKKKKKQTLFLMFMKLLPKSLWIEKLRLICLIIKSYTIYNHFNRCPILWFEFSSKFRTFHLNKCRVFQNHFFFSNRSKMQTPTITNHPLLFAFIEEVKKLTK